MIEIIDIVVLSYRIYLYLCNGIEIATRGIDIKQ